jgi:23S rRNA (uracil1939-C5)-methyltransferase
MSRPRSERREIVIEKLVSGGHGLARVDGEVVLVPRVAPGERVAVEIDRVGKPRRARVLRVLEPSAQRVEAPCAIFGRCGGCDLMHLDRDGQRNARLAILKESLAKVLPDEIEITWHDAAPGRGRTRARWHAKALGDRLALGYHAGSSNTIIDVALCPAIDLRLESAIAPARAILASAKGEGQIHAALGEGGRPTIAIEWRGDLPGAVFAEAERRVAAGELAGVEILIDGAKTPARIGDPRPRAVAADDLPVFAPSRGFAQASEIGDRVLVEIVRARAAAKDKRVAELFAGSGNFTVALARDAAHVTAVEIVAEACAVARENLRARDLRNAKVVEADADAWPIPRDAEVVLLDPPRAGARGASAAIVASKAKRVVYVSCEPTTLARDLGVLLEAFTVEAIDAIDLFPGTSHVETVVTLARRPK